MYKQLTSEQRYTIERLLQNGVPQKKIAEIISTSPSTVCHEIKRNSGKRGYTHGHAQELAEERRERLGNNRRIKEPVIRQVKKLIREDYSPEQISGVLAKDGIKISHETIYKIIRRDKEDGGDLWKHCRHKLKHRKRPVGAASCSHIPDRISISERPKEADGTRFGDFEMDCIVGANNKDVIVTIVERSTNYLMMRKLPFGKSPDELAKVVIKILFAYRLQVLSITTDNGIEFAGHKAITKVIGAKVYFADPYSSWQKGAVENANKLIRQYIPKGVSFDKYTDEMIAEIQKKINNRPRKKLNFETPKKMFFAHFK